jgi:hypothetical protein
LIGVDIGIGNGHHDEEVSHRTIGRVPLTSIDNPLLTIEHGTGLQQGGVGTGGMGFSHREATAHFAGEERIQPAFTVLRVTTHFHADGQQLGVAGVWSVIAKDHGSVRGLAEDLVHEP